MGCRKNQATLSAAERTAFVNAVIALKQAPSQTGLASRYDDFVQIHVDSMTGGNMWAHRRPAFLPWHREYLLRFESELQAIDPSVNLPYWDWTVDNSAASTIWDATFMGGDGTGANHEVETGPFAHSGGNWDITVHDPNDGGFAFLRRNFSGTLPTATQVTNCLAELPYDENPWNDSGTLASFRNRLEGWFGSGSIHNRVHLWVGGADGTMLFSTSPNDPVFWLHHCNIDRLWAEWQKLHPGEPYHPAGTPGDTGPVGHNLIDSMQPWGGTTTVASVQDHHALGYWYDSDEPEVTLTTPSLAFTDVPEGIGGGGVTTYRAVVFEVRSCEPVTLEVTAGPTAGFALTPLGGSVVVPSEHGQQPAIGRIWIAYTSTTAGSVANGSVTIAQTGTANQWVITLTANTIARPKTAAALVLDRSGSMAASAGAGVSRHDKLVEAVEIFVDTMLDGDGLAIISFDDVVDRLLEVTNVGPQPPVPGSGRAEAAAILAGNGLDPRGLTAIGAGVIEAQDALADAQATAIPPYDVQSVVVLTDGLENVAPMLNTIGGSITANTFAIGLGTENSISTAALDTLTQSTGGYLLITGTLTTDQEFRLSKYFLQVLAGLTNAEVVTDPTGELVIGPTHRIPFKITHGDYGCDVILTSPLSPFINFRLQAPDGSIIDPGFAANAPAIAFVQRRYVSYYRMGLPLGSIGKQVHAGPWTALLSLRDQTIPGTVPGAVRGRSVPYNLLVHAYSALRMKAAVDRAAVSPGGSARIVASLSEYGVPVTRASVWAEVSGPSGSKSTVSFAMREEGVFVGEVNTYSGGVYQVRVRARGSTFHGSPFMREQVLSVAGVAPGSGTGTGPDLEQDARDEQLCRLLSCITANTKGEIAGIPVEVLRKCFAEYCKPIRKRRPQERVPAAPRRLQALLSPQTIARLEEGTPRPIEKMLHDVEGPMFGLSPQDRAENERAAPRGTAERREERSLTVPGPQFGLSPQDQKREPKDRDAAKDPGKGGRRKP